MIMDVVLALSKIIGMFFFAGIIVFFGYVVLPKMMTYIECNWSNDWEENRIERELRCLRKKKDLIRMEKEKQELEEELCKGKS